MSIAGTAGIGCAVTRMDCRSAPNRMRTFVFRVFEAFRLMHPRSKQRTMPASAAAPQVPRSRGRSRLLTEQFIE
ncbi:hypothetical protein BST21_21840 [Mycolicibacterium celeriflavum]|nr:hypothetical protein BST21_21840 [Mycolicibacterium celeriflavum]